MSYSKGLVVRYHADKLQVDVTLCRSVGLLGSNV